MDKAKEYINSKTNSIVKYSVKKNNRDVVATIVFNELNKLLQCTNNLQFIEDEDRNNIINYIHGIQTQLYNNVPLKLAKICVECKECNCDINPIWDPYTTGICMEDGTLLMLEKPQKQFFQLESLAFQDNEDPYVYVKYPHLFILNYCLSTDNYIQSNTDWEVH